MALPRDPQLIADQESLNIKHARIPSREEMEKDPVFWANTLSAREERKKSAAKQKAEESSKKAAEIKTEEDKKTKALSDLKKMGFIKEPKKPAPSPYSDDAAAQALGMPGSPPEPEYVDPLGPDELTPLVPNQESANASNASTRETTDSDDTKQLSYSEQIAANAMQLDALNKLIDTNSGDLNEKETLLAEIKQAQLIPYLENQVKLKKDYQTKLYEKANLEKEAALKYDTIIKATKKDSDEFDRATRASISLMEQKIGIETYDADGKPVMKEISPWPRLAHTFFWSVGILANAATSVALQDKGINFPNYLFDAYFKSIDADIDENMQDYQNISALGADGIAGFAGVLGRAKTEIEMREVARAAGAQGLLFEIDAMEKNPDFSEIAANPNFKLMMEQAKQKIGYYAVKNKESNLKRKQIAVAKGLADESNLFGKAAQAAKDEMSILNTAQSMELARIEALKAPPESEFSAKDTEVFGQRKAMVDLIFEGLAIIEQYQEKEGLSDADIPQLADLAFEDSKLAKIFGDSSMAGMNRLGDIGRTMGRYEVKKFDSKLSEIDAEFGEGLTFDGKTKLGVAKHKLRSMLNSVLSASMVDRTLSTSDKKNRIDTILYSMGVRDVESMYNLANAPDNRTLLINSQHYDNSSYIGRFREELRYLRGGID